MFENHDRLWVVHISSNNHVAERAQEEGFICIGWTQLGDLSPYDTPEKMKEAYEQAFPNKSPASVSSSYGQVFRFAHDMEVGDPVVYPIKGSRDILIGQVSGPYERSDDPELDEAHCNNIRKVDWIRQVPRVAFSQKALRSFGSFSTVSRADDYLDEVRTILGERDPQADAVAATSDQEEEETQESESDAQFAAEEVVQATKDYLIRRWTRTAQEFEAVVAAVFRALGYTATVQRGTHDRGVDVIAHADPLGVSSPVLKIQVKSGTSTVGSSVVQQLRGTLTPGEKGLVISLGGFTNDARHTEQNDGNLILINADRFVQLFLDCYDRLSADMRHKFPLQPVYVVAT